MRGLVPFQGFFERDGERVTQLFFGLAAELADKARLAVATPPAMFASMIDECDRTHPIARKKSMILLPPWREGERNVHRTPYDWHIFLPSAFMLMIFLDTTQSPPSGQYLNKLPLFRVFYISKH